MSTEKFTISIDGEKSSEKWHGEFTAKTTFSFRDDLVRDAYKRELLGGANPQFASERALNIAEIFSELRVRIVKAPTWWTEKGNGLDLGDDNVAGAVYKAAVAKEQEELARVKEKAETAQAALRAAAPTIGG